MGLNRLSRPARIVAFCAAIASAPLAAGATTLQDALVAAYLNSNLLEQSRALLRGNDEDVAVALSALRPQVSANASSAFSEQSVGQGGGDLVSAINFSLDLLLYDGGNTRFGVEAAKEAVLASRAQLTNLEQQVLLLAVNAFVSVQRDARTVALSESNLRLITEELRAARDRFEVGEVTRTDVAQAEARLAQARGDLAQAQGNLAISQQLYVAAIGEKPVNLKPVGALPALPGSLAQAVKIAEQNQPSIDQAQHEISITELNAARAKAATLPVLRLNATAGHNTNVNNNASVGVQLNVPIYQGGQLKALQRRALAQVHASKSNLNQVVLEVRQNVSDSWSQLAVANAQLRASERQIRGAQVAFEGVREEARLGARTTLDVLDAEQLLFDARNNRVIFETAVFSAAYQLMSSMGLLTVSELGLPVEQYDPNVYFDAVKTAPVPLSKQGKKLDRILGRYQK